MVNITSYQLLQIYINNPGCLIIDVRSSNEYSKNHIPSSFNIPLDILIKKCILYLNKEFTYYIICNNGFKSKSASAFLIRNNYKAINVIDGLKGWRGPLEKDRIPN